ncbi:peptidase S9 [Kordiimonas sediminis]|uniref:Peptidase S9 n=1 Tax=Kordiimonas sediminis TaxID=1735581 RepID=A0A919APU9_9PROT|nr:S9 family peptidase [Kordiimonas sediminis]GHF16090.1 peptidase S9 [Kordiimonas sediminis]
MATIATGAAVAQDAQNPELSTQLTLDRIYSSDEFKAKRLGDNVWLEDGLGYSIIEEVDGDKDRLSVFKYDPASGDKSVLIDVADLTPDGHDKPLKVEKVIWSEDGAYALLYTNSKRVWRQNTQGDYWVMDLATKNLRKLGKNFPESSLMFAKFSPDSSRVAYVQKTGQKIHDIYIESVTTGALTRLTDDGSETIINGTFDWVYEEEFGLRDGFRWSPDGTKIAYWQLDASGVKDFTLINNTDSLYPTLTTFSYPKVGETNSAARIGVVSASGGDTTWMNLSGDPRNMYVAWMEWASNSEEVAIQQLNRRQNTNHFILASASTGKSRTVLTDTDSAWLDPVTDFRWLEDGNEFLWVSEKDGWRQIYRISRDGKTETALTENTYDVIRIRRIDLAGGYIYFDASPDDPQRQYLYRVAVDGSTPAERLTPIDQPGWHSYSISEDGRFAFHHYSTRDKAEVVDLVSLPDHKSLRTFVDNKALQAAYDAADKGKREFFTVTADDGTTLEGLLRLPPDFDPRKKYPVIFYVYGEPAGMTAADRWSDKNELWHIMMTQKGYIFATVDNRGQPAPKGRDWRKSIYRTLGLTNVNDQADAVKKLAAERPYIDMDRIGIWGHSGGGTSTLHAMFRHADVYSVGVSRAPVPDIRLYDTIYQERYSGILPDDADLYEKAVAINYASGLKGNLLLIHGTGDDNVHYQGSERLINKLVEENIQFDFMSYPNRTHGIREGKNTVRHLMETQTRYFLTHLPAGPKDR